MELRKESEFSAYIRKEVMQKWYVFRTETERTVKGFPDLLCINRESNKAQLIELKYAVKGRFKVQPTQPLFYKQYPNLPIVILVYSEGKIYKVAPIEIVNKVMQSCLHTINLSSIEKREVLTTDEIFNS